MVRLKIQFMLKLTAPFVKAHTKKLVCREKKLITLIAILSHLFKNGCEQQQKNIVFDSPASGFMLFIHFSILKKILRIQTCYYIHAKSVYDQCHIFIGEFQ